MYSIEYRPFPEALRGAVFGLIYGDSNILIDSTQSPERQEITLRHELAHLVLNNRDSDKSLQEIEAEADAIAATYTVVQLETMLKRRLFK